VRGIALVRQGVITHHTDSEQRYMPLEFAIPNERAVIPPGYHMLFVLDDCGVPSEAKFISIS
jgi:hypothetical protein